LTDSRSWTTAGFDEAALAALARGLPASELWSLLLDVFARRAARAPADVQRQYERDAFTQPAVVDQRTVVALDGVLLANAGAFEAVELSPLAPLGACSTVGLASQNKIVSALRGTEVVSDPTNVLALECARRLRADPATDVRLATTHRCVRAQPFPKQPGFAPHFRLFCLATAGRERQGHGFTVDGLVEHLRAHLTALDALAAHGYTFEERAVTLLSRPSRATLADRVAAALDVPVIRAPLEQPYYDGLRFMISARPPGGSGPTLPIDDGGAFDWLPRLTSNRRLVLVASALGSQLVALLFRR
jgi:hypothetical protein